jgi:hypothetical protein
VLELNAGVPTDRGAKNLIVLPRECNIAGSDAQA